MKRVEKYIQEHTKETSSPVIDWDGNIAIYQPWLAPKDARKIGELAREETIKEVCEWLDNHLIDYWSQSVTDGSEFIEDLKKHLESKV